MKNVLYEMIKRLARHTPAGLKAAVRNRMPATDYDIYLSKTADPFANEPPEWIGNPGPLIGITKEYTHYHQHYIKACREMGISYQLIDISRNDWVSTLENSQCDAYLVWPSSTLSIWKEMFDDRLAFMARHMGKLIYPSWQEIWLFENKRRVNYWLEVNKIPHPNTHIFYDQQEAEDFVSQADIPLVLKTNIGASASGVYILRKRSEAVKMVRQAFGKGIVARRHSPNDRHWGYVFLQEYIPIAREWRMVRIGNAYFGHPKGQRGAFHSGSGVAHWDVPRRELLDFVRDITCKGNFTSMDVDIFETNDGQYLVNELQTVFGASVSVDQLRVNGKPGRFIWNPSQSEWEFEEGDFARNACANARLDYLLHQLLKQPDQKVKGTQGDAYDSKSDSNGRVRK